MKRYLNFILVALMLGSLVMTGCASTNAATVMSTDAGCKAVAAPVVAAKTPPTAVAVAAAPQKEIIYFDFDKSNIKASEQPKIDKIIGWMKDPKASAIIIGYTDPIGTDQYNMGLSKKRAEAVKASLVKAGVPADKIKLEWKGETNLAKPGMKGIKDNAPNRRSEVEVVVK